MKQTLTTLVLLLTIVFNMQATSADSIYYHHQPTDTAIIHKILRETRMAGFDNPADRLVYAARKLVNTPYKSGTLPENRGHHGYKLHRCVPALPSGT